jgi:hypothetical protein
MQVRSCTIGTEDDLERLFIVNQPDRKVAAGQWYARKWNPPHTPAEKESVMFT